MPKKSPFASEQAPDKLDAMFDQEDAQVRIDLPPWYQGGDDSFLGPRVNRQPQWNSANAHAVGLAVPGLFKQRRDAALKASALRLLDQGYLRLFREAYNLSPSVPKANKLRAGFEKVGPAIKNDYRAYFTWYQNLLARPDGEVQKKWATDLAGYRNKYDQLRVAVADIQSNKGKTTSAMPGGNLYDPPKEGESWTDWMKRFPTGAGFGFGTILAVGAVLYFWRRG